jgi:hypothetical protein
MSLPTKRKILSFVASLFDPLGLVAPVLLPAKQILQELCRKRRAWDEGLDENELKEWLAWLKDFQGLEEVQVPRCLTTQEAEQFRTLQLHGFSDASERGYGAVVYLRVVGANGNVKCSLILSKSRVTPLKFVSIPRLELAAPMLSARLTAFVKEELSFSVASTTLWTDSLVVLKLINNTTTRFLTFVANRVARIHELSEPEQWHYVDTKTNQADFTSRGMSSRGGHLVQWFSGPEFLWHPNFPPFDLPSFDEADHPLFQSKKGVVIHHFKIQVNLLSEFEGCGPWHILKRLFAWLSRFKG